MLKFRGKPRNSSLHDHYNLMRTITDDTSLLEYVFFCFRALRFNSIHCDLDGIVWYGRSSCTDFHCEIASLPLIPLAKLRLQEN